MLLLLLMLAYSAATIRCTGFGRRWDSLVERSLLLLPLAATGCKINLCFSATTKDRKHQLISTLTPSYSRRRLLCVVPAKCSGFSRRSFLSLGSPVV